VGATQVRSYFGTDGIRGVANVGLTPELALSLGRALGSRLEPRSAVIIGRDTRRSSTMLEGALAAGLASAGVDAMSVGVLPTPAVAEAVPAFGAAAGAMISASHNPFPDNGIKVFGADGFKLADAEEAEVERALERELPRPEGSAVGELRELPSARDGYLDSLVERHGVDLSAFRIAIDCANGATVPTAPALLARLGADVHAIADDPDGININEGCGSTHMERLRAMVPDIGADLGLAFDGDGDRVLAVDAGGHVVDGDQILAILAIDRLRQGALPGPAVVTTSMANLGFRKAMQRAGIEVRETAVGDRYVLEEMRGEGFILGGEQSGHVIDLAHGPTGDGLATALGLLGALDRQGSGLSEAASAMTKMPQRLVNHRVRDKRELERAQRVWDAVRRAEETLADNGRVVVRASGTEDLVRVMVEAATIEECDQWCSEIGAAVDVALGTVSMGGD
jgi:phosphoglucosamine mutase